MSTSPRTPSPKRTTRIVLPTQPTNTDAVRAFMRDCLVPILAKEFLRQRETAAHTEITVSDKNSSFQPLGKKEDGL
jgi:hypothetical protein